MKRYTTLFLILFFAVLAKAQDRDFTISPITKDIQARINGKSYKRDCTVPYSDLRYLRVLHVDAEGKTQRGELICNKAIAQDLIDIFRELYRQKYRIARMVLVDEYDADDERSMSANNTSCFNFRRIAGSKTLSKHSQGLAVDINPLVNPCVSVRSGKIEPASGKPYAYKRERRTITVSNGTLQMIDRTDLCYRLFIQHGFTWGGAWNSKKDYQHFEKK